MYTDIPCVDCDNKKRQLQDAGFRVISCNPIAARPEFCRIEFEEGRAGALHAAAVPSVSAGLTATQIATAQAIINVFETSEVRGGYGKVTVIDGDTGHLTFGRSQTTLGSGNLHTLLQTYCANPGAAFSKRLAPYLPRFAVKDFSLDTDRKLHNVLRSTADDAVMRDTQDAFFDKTYWQPAHKTAENLGVRTALGIAVVYDSHVHGSWPAMRIRATTAAGGNPADVGEEQWILEYLRQRRQWLVSSKRSDLKATVYRMDSFLRLAGNDLWSLPLPLVVRDREISTASLTAPPPGCYDGPQLGSRNIALTSPLMRGLDVRQAQLALSDRDIDILADGIFGQSSISQVKRFQHAGGLPPTGVLDPATIALLLSAL